MEETLAKVASGTTKVTPFLLASVTAVQIYGMLQDYLVERPVSSSDMFEALFAGVASVFLQSRKTFSRK